MLYSKKRHIKKSQEQVWDKIAKKWAEFRTEISPTVKTFLEESKGKVLDIGCGSGRNFMKLKNIDLSAVDFSKKMLELAKERADKLGIKVKLEKADSSKLPFKDNYFDRVLCYAVLHCIESKEKRENTIKEIFRVLKPNGLALISSWGEKSPRLKNKSKECYVPWTIKGESKEKRYTYIFSLKELEELAKNIGFKIISSWEERNVNLIVQK